MSRARSNPAASPGFPRPRSRESALPTRSRALGAALLQAGALLFVAALSISPVASDDAWINVKAGERIWQERAIPAADDYSFTRAGAPWVNHEWLANVIFFAAHAAGGADGLILLKAALLVLAAAVMLRFARRSGVSPALSALLLAAVAFAASDRFIERAHLFNFVLIVLFLDALFRAREGTRPRIWLLPALQALWVNLHSGAVLGPMLVGLFLAGAAARVLLRRAQPHDRSRLRWLAATLGLVVAASFLNPYLGESLLYPFHQAGFDLYRKHVYEWMRIWQPVYAGTPMAVLFWAFVAASLLSFLVPHRPALEDLLVALFFLVLALSAARFTAKFELASFFLLARRLRRVEVPRLAHVAAGVALAGATAAVVWIGNPIRGPLRPFGLGVNDRYYPEGACRILEAVPGGVRLYNQYDLGSYLIWRLGPRVKVFIDGRNQVFPESLYREYLSVNESPEALDRVFRKHAIDAVLIYEDARIPGFLARRPDWSLVWFDDFTYLYLAERPGRETFLDSHAYRLFQPLSRTPETDVLRALSMGREGILRELERAAAQAPAAIKPRLLLVSAYRALRREEDAARWQREVDRVRARYRLD